MTHTFNLVDAAWIPCSDQDRQAVELGIRDTLKRAGELREIGGESPLVTAALHRLLLVVLHRVFGPPGDEEWAALWSAGRWDADRLDAYLETWYGRFDLFDAERPFYQASDSRAKPKSVSSLMYEVASGNNPVLFDHHTDDGGISLAPAEAARMLVAAQSFGLAGLAGPGLPNFTDAPCSRGIVFLVQGGNLFETLMLNMLPYPTDDATMPHRSEDRPAWEMDDALQPDRSRPLGYLDYLTWQNRRVRLIPEVVRGKVVVRDMTMVPGLRLDEGVLNPMSHYRRDERLGPRPLTFREERALWRDSSALFRLKSEGYRSPAAFSWLAELVSVDILEPDQRRRTRALGVSKDKAKVNFYRSERMPLPMVYLADEGLVDDLDHAVNMAEDVRRRLWGAARTLATYVLSPDADSESGRQPAPQDLDALMGQWAVERRYWSGLEVAFERMMVDLPQDREGALETWRTTLQRAAWGAFNPIADNIGGDPTRMKAVIRAQGQLAAGLAKALPAG